MKKDVIIYFAGKFVPAFVNLGIIVLAVRYLGNAEYGKYSMVFYAAMLIGTMTFGWLQQSILRFLSAYPDQQPLVISRFFSLTIISAAFGSLVGLFLCIFYFSLTWWESLVVVAYIFLYNLFMFRLTLNQAQKRSTRYAIVEGTYNLLFISIFLLLVIVFHQTLFIVLFISMVASLLITELFRYTLLKQDGMRLNPFRIVNDREFTRKVFSFGFPMTIWLFSSYLLNIADRFIIKGYTSYENVGTYSAVKDFIIKISTFTTIPILLTYHPLIVEKWNNRRKGEAIKLIREGLIFCFVIAVVVLAGFMFANDIFYDRILHLRVTDRTMISATLIIAAFLWQAAMLLHKPLELLLKPRLMLIAVIVAIAVNAAANLVLVPIYGYPASAVAWLISVLMYILVILVFLLRFHKLGLLH